MFSTSHISQVCLFPLYVYATLWKHVVDGWMLPAADNDEAAAVRN